mmetsp:Transcript_8250/g.30155  ORF Transcript_8250/g.30155 Transcript_8250/m.30155 type:complete len:565 (+) Transcript_8250:713-2407(+)
MPGDVDDVVDAAGDPKVAVGVAAAAVAGDVVALEHGVVHGLEAVVIAVAASRRGRPRLLDGEEAAGFALELVPFVVQNHGLDAEERQRRASGLQRRRPRQRRDHEAARLRLPVRVHDRAPRLADDGVVPPPRLRVDRLADAAENAKRRLVVLFDVRVSALHQRAHGGGRGVKLVHLVLLHDRPAPSRVRVRRHALEHHRRRPREQRPVDDVGVSGDPTDVRGAPVNLPRLVVERVLERRVRADHVPRGGVHDPLRLSRAPGRVQHEQRVLAVDPLAVALGVRLGHLVVPPRVSPVHHRARPVEPLEDDHAGDAEVARAKLERGVDLRLERDRLRAAHDRVAGDDDVGLGVVHASANRLGGESAEDDGVNRAEPRAREARDRELHHHGHVQRHGVALLHALGLEHVGELFHHREDFRVGVFRILGRLVALPQDGNLVAVSLEDVLVQRVVAYVRLPALEPVDEDLPVVHVEVILRPDGDEGRLPVELARHVAEEGLRVVDGRSVHLRVLRHGLDVRVLRERRGGVVDVLLRLLGDLCARRGGDLGGVHRPISLRFDDDERRTDSS